MNAAAQTDSPSSDQTLGAALCALARRIGPRGQTIALVLGLAAAGCILWRAHGTRALAAPAVIVAAFGLWGLATTTIDAWPLPPKGTPDDLRVERALLRVVAVVAVVLGFGAGVVCIYALAFFVAGQTVS